MVMSDDPLCAHCGHPRSNHPYRHPFVGPSWGDTITAQNARIEELEAKLAKAVEALEREIRRVQKIQRDFPPPHKVGLIYVEAEYELMLSELKGQGDEYAAKWED